MGQEKLTEEFVENVACHGLIADRTIRARNKTIIFGKKFSNACREIFKEGGSESDWLSALDYLNSKNDLLALPQPDMSVKNEDKPEAIEAASALREREEQIFGGKSRTLIDAPSTDEQDPQIDPPLIGFLVSFEANRSGEAVSLREGRWVISSSLAGTSSSVLVIDDASVSEFHATLRAKSGTLEISDQMSELGTAITRKGESIEEKVDGGPVSLNHGDLLRLGGRKFSVCLIS